MSSKKTPLDLGELAGRGEIWDGVDPDVKAKVLSALAGYLSGSGESAKTQAGLLRARAEASEVATRDARMRQLGIRPGVRLTPSQRAAVEGKEESKDEKMRRLQFHGGMANGVWTNSYDVWRAASKDGVHGTNSKGETIKTRPFGFSVPGPKPDRAKLASQISEMSARGGGDRRGVVLDRGGMLEFHYGDTRGRPDIVSGETVTALAAKEKLRILGDLDETWTEEAWPWDSPEPTAPSRPGFETPSWITRPVNSARTWLSGLFSASKGGRSVRAADGAGQPRSGFGYKSFEDQMREKKNLFDRQRQRQLQSAQRTAARQTERVGDMLGLSGNLRRAADYDTRLGRDGTVYQTADDRDALNPMRFRQSDTYAPGATFRQARDAELNRQREEQFLSGDRGKAVASFKGGVTMRERGWLDSVFARAERAAARGGRTRR